MTEKPDVSKPPGQGTVLTFSRALASNTQVAEVMGAAVHYCGGFFGLGAEAKAALRDGRATFVGWGCKPNTRRARALASENQAPYIALEDGFIGYQSHPAKDDRRLSIIRDARGIYYDSSRPSDLEYLLNDKSWITEDVECEAQEVLSRIVKIGVSKYNHGTDEIPGVIASTKGRKVLIVDQTFGDQSISLGGASADSFGEMLQTALAENLDATLFLKVHPDVLLGTKTGHFNLEELPERVVPIATSLNPQALLELMDAVYVVTSQMGFEGLLAGKPVHVFGLPFYAGWGLTRDRGPTCDRREGRPTLLHMVAAALIKYPIYLDPYLGGLSDIQTVLDYIEAERALSRLTEKRVFPLNFSIWKRSFIESFAPGASQVTPITTRALDAIKWQIGDAVLVWGRKSDHLLAALPEFVDVVRMEDGFLRSKGLGSDLARPLSLALDQTGIYYDARTPSDLETFLNTWTFTERHLARGTALKAAVTEARVTKYNVGIDGALDFRAKAEGRPVILVPGQVESDASLAFGSPEIQRNYDLLGAVRDRNPEAYIVYKPHPDEVSGNREGSAGDMNSLADDIVLDTDILTCFEAVDEVHTMTSLSGFEALIRGLPVTTYGMPFYAGWGLTTDILNSDRRNRRVPLEGLIYALFCIYGRYAVWPSGKPSIPEAIIRELTQARASGVQSSRSAFGRLGQYVRKLSGLWGAFFGRGQ